MVRSCRYGVLWMVHWVSPHVESKLGLGGGNAQALPRHFTEDELPVPGSFQAPSYKLVSTDDEK